MSWYRSLLCAALLALAGQTVTGCNAVLGIEQAELDPNLDTASGPLTQCQPRQAPPPTNCAVCPESCQTSCLEEIKACFADHECRTGVQEYRRCLGDKCTDTNKACQGCASPGTKLKALTDCIAGCSAGCSVAHVIDPCEEYCQCMQAQCGTQMPDGSGCVAACQSGSTDPTWQARFPAEFSKMWTAPQPAFRPYCLLDHCELAPLSVIHCGHAIGNGPQCDNPVLPKTSPDCPSRTKYGGAACQVDSECCGGTCLPSHVCNDP